MANKNYSGTQFMRAQSKEDRLIENIDRRDGNGENMENVDHTYNNHDHVNTSGERVWSF